MAGTLLWAVGSGSHDGMSIDLSEVARRADAFFMEKSPSHDAMRRLLRTLDEMGIPFAIAGAMAANACRHCRAVRETYRQLWQATQRSDFGRA